LGQELFGLALLLLLLLVRMLMVGQAQLLMYMAVRQER
jgi:hypothetical protein